MAQQRLEPSRRGKRMGTIFAASRSGAREPSRWGKLSLGGLVWIAVSLACLGLVGSASWAAWNAYERTIERATANAQNLTRVLKQHTERTIDSVDMMLRVLAHELGPDTADPVRRSSTSAILAYVVRGLPHLLALRVVEPQRGAILFDFVRARDISEQVDPPF
jgi:hypothetical protein